MFSIVTYQSQNALSRATYVLQINITRIEQLTAFTVSGNDALDLLLMESVVGINGPLVLNDNDGIVSVGARSEEKENGDKIRRR